MSDALLVVDGLRIVLISGAAAICVLVVANGLLTLALVRASRRESVAHGSRADALEAERDRASNISAKMVQVARDLLRTVSVVIDDSKIERRELADIRARADAVLTEAQAINDLARAQAGMDRGRERGNGTDL